MSQRRSITPAEFAASEANDTIVPPGDPSAAPQPLTLSALAAMAAARFGADAAPRHRDPSSPDLSWLDEESTSPAAVHLAETVRPSS